MPASGMLVTGEEQRDDMELFFSLMPDHDPKRTTAGTYVRVTDQAYKMRDLPVVDPDNNLILFGSPRPGYRGFISIALRTVPRLAFRRGDSE